MLGGTLLSSHLAVNVQHFHVETTASVAWRGSKNLISAARSSVFRLSPSPLSAPCVFSTTPRNVGEIECNPSPLPMLAGTPLNLRPICELTHINTERDLSAIVLVSGRAEVRTPILLSPCMYTSVKNYSHSYRYGGKFSRYNEKHEKVMILRISYHPSQPIIHGLWPCSQKDLAKEPYSWFIGGLKYEKLTQKKKTMIESMLPISADFKLWINEDFAKLECAKHNIREGKILVEDYFTTTFRLADQFINPESEYFLPKVMKDLGYKNLQIVSAVDFVEHMKTKFGVVIVPVLVPIEAGFEEKNKMEAEEFGGMEQMKEEVDSEVLPVPAQEKAIYELDEVGFLFGMDEKLRNYVSQISLENKYIKIRL